MVFFKKPFFRYMYSFIIGFALNVFMYEKDVIHPVIMIFMTYFIIHAFSRTKQHVILFVVIYFYQSVLHINRMVYHYGEWGAEITAFTMNLVCRLISIGF